VPENQTQGNGEVLLVGTLVGGLIAAAATMLLAPKSGRDVREGIAGRYSDMTDKTRMAAEELGEKTVEMAGAIGDKTKELAGTVGQKSREMGMGREFLLGGLVGATAALLLAPKSGRELRADVAGQCSLLTDKTRELASSFSQKSQEIAQQVSAATSDLAGKVTSLASGFGKGGSASSGEDSGEGEPTKH